MSIRFSRFLPLAAFLLALPLVGGTLYSDGAIAGNKGSYMIGSYPLADSFQLSSTSIVTGVNFGAWIYGSATGASVEWGIWTDPTNPATQLASGTAALSGTFLFNNPMGTPVWRESFTIPNVSLAAGTYWLRLGNSMLTDGTSVWYSEDGPQSMSWDISNGPSQAWLWTGGSVPSHSFDILGQATPEPASAALLCSGALLLCAGLIGKRKPRA
jgi:hypothetical protein